MPCDSIAVSDHALFHPKIGDTIEIEAGDTMYFDNDSKGTWGVLKAVRKSYLMYKHN